jgi:hypothetical protein
MLRGAALPDRLDGGHGCVPAGTTLAVPPSPQGARWCLIVWSATCPGNGPMWPICVRACPSMLPGPQTVTHSARRECSSPAPRWRTLRLRLSGFIRFAGVHRALRRIGSERTGMDSRRLDQITRSFASGMSRRAAMKGIAAALGLSAVGALRAPAAAGGSWTFQQIYCVGAGLEVNRCVATNKSGSYRYKGETCGLGSTSGPFTTKEVCCTNSGIMPCSEYPL